MSKNMDYESRRKPYHDRSQFRKRIYGKQGGDKETKHSYDSEIYKNGKSIKISVPKKDIDEHMTDRIKIIKEAIGYEAQRMRDEENRKRNAGVDDNQKKRDAEALAAVRAGAGPSTTKRSRTNVYNTSGWSKSERQQMSEEAPLGSGGRFKKLAKKVHSKALAAWIGRKKYGKDKFQKLAEGDYEDNEIKHMGKNLYRSKSKKEEPKEKKIDEANSIHTAQVKGDFHKRAADDYRKRAKDEHEWGGSQYATQYYTKKANRHSQAAVVASKLVDKKKSAFERNKWKQEQLEKGDTRSAAMKEFSKRMAARKKAENTKQDNYGRDD